MGAASPVAAPVQDNPSVPVARSLPEELEVPRLEDHADLTMDEVGGSVDVAVRGPASGPVAGAVPHDEGDGEALLFGQALARPRLGVGVPAAHQAVRVLPLPPPLPLLFLAVGSPSFGPLILPFCLRHDRRGAAPVPVHHRDEWVGRVELPVSEAVVPVDVGGDGGRELRDGSVGVGQPRRASRPARDAGIVQGGAPLPERAGPRGHPRVAGVGAVGCPVPDKAVGLELGQALEAQVVPPVRVVAPVPEGAGHPALVVQAELGLDLGPPERVVLEALRRRGPGGGGGVRGGRVGHGAAGGDRGRSGTLGQITLHSRGDGGEGPAGVGTEVAEEEPGGRGGEGAETKGRRWIPGRRGRRRGRRAGAGAGLGEVLPPRVVPDEDYSRMQMRGRGRWRRWRRWRRGGDGPPAALAAEGGEGAPVVDFDGSVKGGRWRGGVLLPFASDARRAPPEGRSCGPPILGHPPRPAARWGGGRWRRRRRRRRRQLAHHLSTFPRGGAAAERGSLSLSLSLSLRPFGEAFGPVRRNSK